MKSAHFIFCAMAISLCGGCASMVRGDKQTVKFQTDPASATVNIDGKEYASPADVELDRNKTHTVIVSSPGYEPVQFSMKPTFDAAILGNLLLPAGAFGFVLDATCGGGKKFDQLSTIHLEPTTAPATAPVSTREARGQLVER
jgi:predicted component of type VI protein secretion system